MLEKLMDWLFGWSLGRLGDWIFDWLLGQALDWLFGWFSWFVKNSPFAISLAALMIAWWSLYLSHRRKGRLLFFRPTLLAFVQSPGQGFGLGLQVSVKNTGAVDHTVNYMHLTLSDPEPGAGRVTLVMREDWDLWGDGPLPGRVRRMGAFSVPPGGAVVKNVVFSGREGKGWEPDGRKYRLDFFAVTDGAAARKPRFSLDIPGETPPAEGEAGVWKIVDLYEPLLPEKPKEESPKRLPGPEIEPVNGNPPE
jgi:hypothetical protein